MGGVCEEIIMDGGNMYYSAAADLMCTHQLNHRIVESTSVKMSAFEDSWRLFPCFIGDLFETLKSLFKQKSRITVHRKRSKRRNEYIISGWLVPGT